LHSNIVGVLGQRAREVPERVAFTFLANGEVEEAWLTYQELDLRARALAARLAAHGLAGQRAMLLYPPGLDFIVAFFGCFYAGTLAVPAYPPASERSLPRLAAILASARPQAILTTSALLGKLERAAAKLPGTGALIALATDTVAPELAAGWTRPAIDLDHPAFLQYTSGSTSDPKGVIVRHGNLLHNEEMIRQAFGQSAESVIVGWLPLYHDMGLIGNVLQTLYAGATCILMSPLAFLTRPVRWLQAISRYRATTSGGPNFAYDLCARKATDAEIAALDLRSWEVAYNGAEPVRAATLRLFAERFAPCGFRAAAFYPCYGLAEATLFVAGGTLGVEPAVRSFATAALAANRLSPAEGGEEGRELVSCGRAWLEQEIAIVDPETGVRCAPGQVGEIWVAGPSVAGGYWQLPEATSHDFGARLAAEPEAGLFLRTGDLGAAFDGELFVTGRAKDLIIIRGRNHYPQDLELTFERCHSDLRPGCSTAFAIEREGEERVVIVGELERGASAGLEEIAAAARQALSAEHEIALHDLVLVRPQTIPKTSSGKVQRRACRAAYLAGGGLDVIARSRGGEGAATAAGGEAPAELDRGRLLATPPAERLPALVDALRRAVARIARVPYARVPVAAPLLGLGLDSLAAVELQSAVERAFGVSVGLGALLDEGMDVAGLAEEVLARLAAAPAAAAPGGARPDEGEQPASIGQRSIWFVDRLAHESAVFNLAGATEVQAPLPAGLLRACLERLAERHPMLRTTFKAAGAELGRVVHPRLAPVVEEADGRGWSAAEVDAWEQRAAFRPFDLETEPPLRAALLRRGGEGPDVLLLVVHHIAADFWSVAILLRDLARAAAAGGAALAGPPPAASYSDFVAWQEEELGGPLGERAWAYWRRQLAGELPLLDLPTDRPRPPVQSHRGGAVELRLAAGALAPFRRRAREEATSLFAALLAPFSVLLGRWSGQCDLLIGLPVAGRTRPELAGLVGYCVNPVPLRIDLTGGPDLRQLLPRLRAQTVGALENQSVPLALLVERLQPERDPSRSPLFQVAFALQRSQLAELPDLSAFALGRAGDRLDLGGLPLVSRALRKLRVQFDLMLVAAEVGDGLGLSFQYNADLFDRETIERMAGQLARLIDGLAARPDQRVEEVPLLAPAESEQLLAGWNATAVPRQAVPLARRLAAQARRTPRAVALRSTAGALLYEELDARANRLARHLAGIGVRPGVRVGIAMERGADLVIALFAAVKAGATYVPLDVEYPAERLRFMLEAARVEVVVTLDRWAERVGRPDGQVVRLDTDAPAVAAESAADPDLDFGVDLLLYVIFTSGSTGRPKGAAVYQRSFLNLLDWFVADFGLGPEDRTLLVSSFSFDLTQKNLFAPFLVGGELQIEPPGPFDPALVAGRIAEWGTTLVNCTPSAFYPIAEALLARGGASPLRHVFLGGEPISVERLGRWLEPEAGWAQVVNTYGPTECTDIAAFHRLGAPGSPAGRPVPVGRPVDNVSVHVLDRGQQLCPVEVPGEVGIGGAGVGLGYLNDAALTAERFVPSPFAGRPGDRLYRTGDLARRLPSGELLFHGRIDHQVKVRGFRIELGEIEAELLRHPGVEEAVVLLSEGAGGSPRLVAYVVPDPGEARPVRELAALDREGGAEGALRCELPNGMTIFHQNRAETDFVYHELFEEESYLRHGVTLADGATVFDVGANIGLFDLYLARKWRDLRIFAFEPLPPILRVLRLNLQLYGAPVQVFPHGLASAPSTVTFDYYPHVSILSGRFADSGEEHETVRKFLLAQLAPGRELEEGVLEELLADRLERQSFECEVRTLSEVVRETGVERIDLLKVDVEKAELDVLQGLAEEDWPKVQQVVAEVHDLDGRLATITDLLHRHGFTVALEREEVLRGNEIWNLFAGRPGAPLVEAPPLSLAPRWGESCGRLVAELRSSLAERLPDYMVPASFVLLDRLPLTPNGKLDRRALPAPESAPAPGPARPLAVVEEILAGFWGEVLGIAPPHDPESHFFDLGGHSLLATQLISRLRDGFAVDLPVRQIFQTPTLAGMARAIEEARAAGGWPDLPPLVPRKDAAAPAPLSFAQERLWFLHQLEPESALYNVPGSLLLAGRLDVAALSASFAEAVARHAALRTTFAVVAGRPVQVVAAAAAPALPRIDLSRLAAEARVREAERISAAEAARPFVLARGPLFRATLLRLAPSEHRILVTQHHIVSDGWSVEVLARELGALYASFLAGRPSPLPTLPIQYVDFAVWQRGWLTGEVLERQIAHWRQALSGLPPLALPTDHPRPPERRGRGAQERLALEPPLPAGLAALSRSRGATLFMTLCAGLAALLARYSGQEDVALGAPVANRTHRELEGIVGFFVNTLVLRVDLGGEPAFATLLGRVGRAALAAYAHQDLPFEKLVEALSPERDPSRTPLFQVLFALQNAPAGEVALPGLTLEVVETATGTAKFDLTLTLVESGNGLVGTWEYDRDLFDRTTIARLSGQLALLLAGAVGEPQARIGDLPLLSAAERQQLCEWQEGAVAYQPAPVSSDISVRGFRVRCLHELFEEQVDRTPDATAVVAGGVRLTYRELDRRANRLAHLLRRLGVGPESRVAVCLVRSERTVEAVLGVLKAGGAYVPLDPTYPRERLELMLEDSGACLLVTESGVETALPCLAGRELPRVQLDADSARLAAESDRRPAVPVDPGHLSYLIYTSGSTGRPKAVAIAHRSPVTRVLWAGARFGPEELAGVLAATSLCFDLSVFEVFVPLAHGGRVIVAADALSLPRIPAAAEVTLVNTVPSTLAELLRMEGLPGSVRTVNLAGEPIPPDLAGAILKLRPERRLWNLYGPSEDTTYSTGARLEPAGGTPIGRPLDGTWVRLLDPRGERVPPGVPGEIHLGGAGLARGYLSLPGLTAERFVPDPLGGEPGARLYRTGDLARYRRDGALEYLGRLDHQVKIRGFRVELGEIEAALAGHPAVVEAVAASRGAPEALLAAWVVPAEGTAPSGPELAEWLRERLPEPLIPSQWTFISALPRQPNSKVDRRALPEPAEPVPSALWRAPRQGVEEVLAAIWADLLGRERVGAGDDFWQLGGHSLLGARMIHRVRETLGVDLPLRALFERRTLEALAARVEKQRAALRGEPAAADEPLLATAADGPAPLSPAQERFWFLDRLAPGSTDYNLLLALELSGELRAPALAAALAALVRRHDAFRTVFVEAEEGPVQRIAPPRELLLPLVDLSGLGPELAAREALRQTREETGRPFDLAAGRLLRAGLIRRGAGDHLLLVATHHIAFDGSHELFLRELAALYAAPQTEPAPPAVRYQDFARWERRRLASPLLLRQLAYWRHRLGTDALSLELPFDRRRPAVRGGRGASVPLVLGPALRGAQDLARRQGTTLFMVVLAGFQALLHRVTEQVRIRVGTPVVVRPHSALERTIGCFTNTLVLCGELTPDLAGSELLSRAREEVLGAFANRDLPFEALVRALQPERDLSRTPLFQTMLSLTSPLSSSRLELPGLSVSFPQVPLTRARFDLLLGLWETGEGDLAGTVEYDRDLFDLPTAQRLAGHFQRLLAGLAADPERPIGDLPLLGEGELHQVVSGWNDTRRELAEDLCLDQLFAARAALSPEAPAVAAGGEEWTYRELDRRSNRLAWRLIGLGVGPGTAVGIHLERTAHLVAGLLAVHKAGAAYVPLETSLPEERLAIMASAAEVRHVLTQRSLVERVAAWGGGTRRLVVVEETAGPDYEDPPPRRASPDAPAYVIFTSGSTGVPKGVVVRHRPVVNLIDWVNRTFGVGPGDRALFVTSPGFDLSVYDVFGFLAAGACVQVAAEDELAEPRRLLDVLCREPVTFWSSAPAALQRLEPFFAAAETRLSRLRLVFLSGDWLPLGLPDSIRRAFPHATIVNLGGATEATVWSNSYTVGAIDPAWASIPYGRPIQNARYHVLDGALRPCPIGVAGDLYISGPCLADGYLGEALLTASAFVPDPWGGEAGGRLYRTGDRVRFHADGNLEFLGRRDQQVKIRGYRIELGEIEAVLSSHPQVREAVAAVRPERNREARLVAYVVPDGEAPTAADLSALARRRLPEPMIPSAFVVLDALPLTANGKVDRKALPAPADSGGEAAAMGEPGTPLEEILALLWAETLDLGRAVGAGEDFFALGGHSLLAARLAARVRETLGADLPLRAVFEAPTPAALARRAGELLRGGSPPALALDQEPRPAEPPLSFAQERLWVLERMAPGNAAYHIPAALRIGGGLDASTLAQSLGEIRRRHEVLRTRFVLRDEAAVQEVDPAVAFRLPQVDLAGCPEALREREVERLTAAEVRHPFALEEGPLLRALLVRLAGQDHVVLTTLHHIVADGPSVEILIRELGVLYPAFHAGLGSPLPRPALQYADFALWQRRRMPEIAAAQLPYWRGRLAGAPPLLELPLDRPRPPVESFHGSSLSVALPPAVAAGVEALAARSGVTRFMAWLGLFKALLARLSRQDDLLVGFPFANRERSEFAGLIGLFVNTLVLRTHASRDLAVGELLDRVREAALGAYAHADLPFERLLEELQPKRDLSHHPLFQVLFALAPDPQDLLDRLPGLELRLLPATSPAARFDLSLNLAVGARGAVATLEFRTDLFDRATAGRLLGYLTALASAAVADPGRLLGRLPLLSEEERGQLAAWSSSPAAPPSRILVHARIAERALAFPDALALACGEERLSYGELDRRAARLADRLRRLGVGAETRVGVCLERSPALVVALLAVFKSGGVYVPLDPAYPEERITFLLADAGISRVVTESRFAGRLPLPEGAAILLDTEEEASGAAAAAALPQAAREDALAYLIYTSGSTGRPKGVAVEHGSLGAVLSGMVQELGFGAGDSIPAIAPVSFDISLFELLAPLLAGGACRLLPESPLDLRPLLALLGEVTCLHAVPVLMRQMVRAVREEGGDVAARCGQLRLFLVGGDRVPPDLVEELRSLFPAARVRILYGPTESTIVCASCPVADTGPVERALVGRPLPGAVLRLWDEDLEPVPQGTAAEIYVGGAGVARGYWNRDELTRERFVVRGGERYYRTGDLARHLPDGTLEFLGRSDQQVKIRGCRVDPGEVEAALGDHPAVRETAVVALADLHGDDRLIGYVVPALGGEPWPGPADLPRSLRESLAERLPEFMVPSLIVILEALPLTPHGKIDRRALPVPDARRSEAESRSGLPATPLERELAEIWSAVLGISPIGVHDNFFHLGGHSLLATRALARIHRQLGFELPLRLLFELPTVAQLAGALAARTGDGLPQPPPLEPAAPPGPASLSFAQERLWFLDRMDPGRAVYNVSSLFRLEGDLPADRLELGLHRVVDRHEALRTRFAAEDGDLVQIASPAAPWRLPVIELAGLPPAAREAELWRLAAGEAWRPFDLAAGPLLRTLLLEAGEGGRALLVATHHIVSDAWSMGVLARDLAALLRAGEEETSLPPLSVRYSDYAVWQRRWLTGAALEARLAYWRRQLAGAPAALALPVDRPRPAVQTFQGRLEPVALSPARTAALRAFARGEGATPFLVLLAVFEVLLFRLSGQADFCVGSPVSGRGPVETEDLVGLFVNTLVLRADLSGEPVFRATLARVREVALVAQAHQDVPLEKLIAELQPQRDLSHSPLFQVLFGLHGAPRTMELPGARLVPLPLPAPTAKFDLSLLLSDSEGSVEGGFEYNTDLFEPVTLRRIAGYLDRLVETALTSPELPVGALPLLSAAESHQLGVEWSATAAAVAPRDGELLHELFAAQAARTPGAVALIDGDRRVTYGELRRRVGHLARRLRALGVGPEARVGVCSRRTAELVASLLAVVEAGGAYVPLDPAYPMERLAFILADARAAVLLVQPELRDLLPPGEIPLLPLDEEAFSPGAPEVARPPVLAGNLAYLIYTSGSTGRPKGVAIEHRSAVAFLGWAGEAFAEADLEGVLASTSICFDLSVFEIFAPLARGGAVVLAADALALPGLPAAAQVTLVNTVPSAAAELARLGGFPPGVRIVNLAGEPLRRELVAALYETSGVRAVLNLYGPSEDTTYSTWSQIARGDRLPPAIGRPVAGTRALVLDPGFRRVPAGATGELFLGGAGLARCYLGRPELTAERFVPDPYGPSGERLYRTGDLVRHRPDGCLDFLGRGDHQVKVRGFRIEMGEIEAELVRHPALREAVVVAVERGPDELGLIAYVVPDDGAGPGRGDLREHLAKTLPGHMIPADFVVLAAIPRTPNGKVDHRALPTPEPAGSRAAVSLRTPLEEIVADAWREVLRLPAVDGGDDFFALGGHSLLAIRAVSRLTERLGVELPLRALFQHPTVTSLALEVERCLAAGSAPRLPQIERLPRDGGPLPLSFAQERLLFFDRMAPGSPLYNVNGVFRLNGPLDLPALAAGFCAVVRRHESLRTRFVAHGQVIVPERGVPLPRVDLRGLPPAVREGEAQRRTTAEAHLPFDLDQGLLLRALLLQMEEGHHLLAVTLHHIACDGWSLGILIQEVLEVYAARLAGRPPALPDLPLQYADFAGWQRQFLQGELLEEQLAYWTRHLDGAPPLLALPFDRPRPLRPSYRGGRHRLDLSPEPTAALKALGRVEGATLFMTLLAAWCILLQRYSGQSDIVVGSNIANRHRRSLEGLIGLLANTVALHVDLSGDPTVRELLVHVREVVLGAHAHQDLPFEKLVEALRPDRDVAYHPIFQVMLVMQEEMPRLSAASGLEVSPIGLEHGSAKFDLTLFAVEEGEGVAVVLEYDAELFAADTIADLAGQLAALLEALPAWAGEPISALRFVSMADEESLLGALTESLEI
jgi:amino acid adenylation domain-containing protein/FkbM family methyltransferase